METSIDSKGQVKESPIDQRYRLLLLNRYLKNAKEVPVACGGSKWIFCCPFCSPLGRTEAKRNERKGVLLWNGIQNSWVFCCHRCGISTTFYRFLMLLNPQLAKTYQRERWHSGTTGKGHNCPDPPHLVRGGSIGVSTAC